MRSVATSSSNDRPANPALKGRACAGKISVRGLKWLHGILRSLGVSQPVTERLGHATAFGVGSGGFDAVPRHPVEVLLGDCLPAEVTRQRSDDPNPLVGKTNIDGSVVTRVRSAGPDSACPNVLPGDARLDEGSHDNVKPLLVEPWLFPEVDVALDQQRKGTSLCGAPLPHHVVEQSAFDSCRIPREEHAPAAKREGRWTRPCRRDSRQRVGSILCNRREGEK
jgi:hypothetical protein